MRFMYTKRHLCVNVIYTVIRSQFLRKGNIGSAIYISTRIWGGSFCGAYLGGPGGPTRGSEKTGPKQAVKCFK